jgi:flagellar biosynthesis GTPase FlhF
MNNPLPTSQPTDAADSIGGGEVRTYRGRTLQELIPQIKADLGPGAIILREREGVTGGVGGFFAQRCVEIDAQASPRVSVYADDLDEDDEFESEPDEAEMHAEEPAGRLVISAPVLASPEAQAFAATGAPWAEIAAAAPQIAAAAPPAFDEATFAARLEQAALAQPEAPAFIAFDEMAAPEPEPEPLPEPVLDPILNPEPEPAGPFVATPLEIPVPVAIDTPAPAAPAAPLAPAPAVLKRRRRGGLAERVVRAAQAARVAAAQVQAPAPVGVAQPAPVTAPPAPAARPSAPARRAPTEELQRRLLDAGLTRTRAHELIAAALEITEDDELLIHALRHELTGALPAPPPLPSGGGVIAVVGPGGSGKTRCVAALAVACARAGSRPVSVARLGSPARGTELAELVRGENVSVIPAMRTHATVRAVSSARERGLVILDTPAASPGEPSSVDVLGDALAQFRLDGVYLAVPATFTARAAARMTKGFAPLGLRGLLATHVDEADQLGVVAELSMQTGLPLSHAHAGIDVTTSLAPMDPDQIAEVLLP